MEKLACHGITGSCESLPKKRVIGQLACPYEDAFAWNAAGGVAESTMEEPSSPIAAVAFSDTTAPDALSPMICG